MSIQNLLGKRNKRYFISFILFNFLKLLAARNLFEPLGEYESEWCLEELNPIPLRIQYRGNIKLPNGEDKYVFLVNGRCVYASLNEAMPEQFVLKQVLSTSEAVIVQDGIDGGMYTLKLGEICYRTECFCGKILNKNTGICYTFSHVNNRIKLDKQEILLSMRQNDFSSIQITVFTENKVPFSYRLLMSASKSNSKRNHEVLSMGQ